MELRELGYFIAVFEEGSVSAAARRCFISQPSVSAALAGLEAELATALFVRHRRGAEPTAAAARLYPIARRLVDDARGLAAAFRAPAPPRVLTIGLMRSLDAARVRELLRGATQAPELRVRVVDADARADLRVVSRGLARAAETFVPLWSERFVVALPAGHPLALRASVRTADLIGERLIERCHCEIARHVARGLRQLEPVASAASEELALALVGAGVGLALVPEGSARDAVAVVVRPIADATVTREVGLAVRARPSADVQRVTAELRRRFGPAARGRGARRAA